MVGNWEDWCQELALPQLCYKLGQFPLAAKLRVGLKFFLSVELNAKSLDPPSFPQFGLCYPSADRISHVPVGVASQVNIDLPPNRTSKDYANV